jgi:predicted methyltransferase
MKSILFDSAKQKIEDIIAEVSGSIMFLPEGKYEVLVRKPVRTSKQNNALHVLFAQIAEILNSEGQCFRYTGLKGMEIEAQWDEYKVKEFLWRPVQFHLTGKRSTTELTTNEIDKVFEPLNAAFAEKGIEVRFPSNFDKYLQQINEK